MLRLLAFIPVAVWLFTQMVMTGGWSPGTAAIGAAEYAGRPVVICTGEGLVTIYLDENGDPVEEDGVPVADPCTWCMSFSTPPTLVASGGVVPFAACAAGPAHFAPGRESLRAQAPPTRTRIRAPPGQAMPA